jgi:hypothetical protein
MAVKRFIRLAGLALMTLALVACEGQQERYFRRNVNRASGCGGETVWATPSCPRVDHRGHRVGL